MISAFKSIYSLHSYNICQEQKTSLKLSWKIKFHGIPMYLPLLKPNLRSKEFVHCQNFRLEPKYTRIGWKSYFETWRTNFERMMLNYVFLNGESESEVQNILTSLQYPPSTKNIPKIGVENSISEHGCWILVF